MKTKAKKFSRKLLALLMAIVMGLTCFSGVLSAYGASIQDYHDNNVEYNNLAWDILSDEQTCTALLDYSDQMLAEFGPQIDSLLARSLPTDGMYFYNKGTRSIGLNVGGIIKANIKVYTHSVDELMETIESVASVIADFKSFIGDAGNIQLGSTKGVRRSNTSSCDIVRCVLGILQKNVADKNGKDVIGELLRGGFDLGTVGNLANLDLYTILGNALGLEAGYQTNLVYNLVQSLLFNNTKWFTEEEKLAYKGGGTLTLEDGTTKQVAAKTFVYDDVLLEKMTVELLDKISVLVTYADGTSSADRKVLIDEKMAAGATYEQACNALGYDPNLIYSEEEAMKGNILLFAYGKDKIKLTAEDSLFAFGFQALDMAWDTVLKDTLQLLHVNYSREEQQHGSNFDNTYYYWASKNIPGGWDKSNLPEMYSEANVSAWAQAVYKDYDADSPEQFIGWVRDNLTYDRSAAADSTGAWSDIDETTLFNKTRYSLLADYYFNIQTGPINLYIMQTGAPHLEAFFADDNYRTYTSLAGGLNDALVAAVQDIFIDRDNIKKGDGSAISAPQLDTINPSTLNDTDIRNIASTLTNNALKVIQYTADTVDANILKAFYDAKGAGAPLTEANLEGAMIPLLIACIGQINLGSGKLERVIHPETWNGCKDAEAVAYVALTEYLSYVIPGNDYSSLVTVDEDGTINATLDGTILPMARDAVIYVCQSMVPVTYNGQEWRAEDPNHDQNATIFDLLNSVICYYAADYDMAKSDDRAMGVGAVLGLCDSNGASTIKSTNTLWQNLDLVVNHVFPVIGTLQGRGYGNASSYDLIWNDIVLGVLEIGDTSTHASGFGGVTNFIYRFLSIISATPIKDTPVVLTVYDVLADLLNALFGSRYGSSAMLGDPIPARTSAHPFDDLVQVASIAGTSGTNVGAIQKAIYNFVAFFGYGTSGASTFPDSMLRGVSFALQAVNSFIPEAIENISDHSLRLATSTFANSTVQGCSSGNSYTSTVDITNNSTGVNGAYVDGMNDSVVQMSRYYIKVTGTSIANGTIASPTSALIAPGEKASFATSVPFQPSGSEDNMSTSATITYDILLADGTVLYSDLTTTCYQYLTSAVSWEDIVYPVDRNGMLNGSLEMGRTDTNQERNVSGYKSFSSAGFRDGKLYVTYPEYLVISTANPKAIERFQFRVNNQNLVGSSYSVDGFYCYDEKTVYDDATGKNVTVGQTNAIPIFNKETGDLIKYGLYDISKDGGKTWDRTGYTSDQVGEIAKADTSVKVTQRDHVVYTIEEAVSAGIIAAWHKNAAGVVEYVYMKSGSGTNYDTTLGQVSLRGPINGIYINQGKLADIPKNGSKYTTDLFKYDGKTPLKAGSYPVKLCCYSSYNNGNGSGSLNSNKGGCTLVIGDNNAAEAVGLKYNELAKILANYRQSDFTSAEVYTLAQNAMVNALAAQAAVLTPTSAIELSDTTVLTAETAQVASQLGDAAFVPFTTDNWQTLGMPVTVYADAYEGTVDLGAPGVLYFDENRTMPIYSSTPLTAGDVTDGMDPAGVAVAADANGTYRLVNEPSFEKEWDTTTYQYPWLTDKYDELGNPIQATNDKGALLYEQVQYTYRDKDGNECKSTDEWACKFPVASYKTVPNDGETENRGKFTLANDYLQYVIEQVYKSIDTSIAQSLFENMSKVRNNLNQNNFEVVTFNKMVNAAKAAERKYTLNITYTYQEPVLDENGNEQRDNKGEIITQEVTKTDEGVPFSGYNGYAENPDITITNITTTSTLSSVQVEEYQRLFNLFLGKAVERGYIGDQIEAEILCASGNAYNTMTATPATYDEATGDVVTEAVVTKTTAGAPRFGAWDANGNLVNEGDTVYTAASWNNYVRALADAIDVATLGNGSYAHKTANYYDVNDADNYKATVSKCYYTDTALQTAENMLEVREVVTLTIPEVTGATVKVDGVPYTAPVVVEKGVTVSVEVTPAEGYNLEYISVGDTKYRNTTKVDVLMGNDVVVTPVLSSAGHNVTGSIVVATKPNGTTNNVAVNGNYTVSIYNADNDALVAAQTFAMSADNNTFTFVLPAGNFYATVESDYALTRGDINIVVNDADIDGGNIPIIACDFNKDGIANGLDAIIVYKQASGAGSVYCDLDGSSVVNGLDAIIVYACASGNPALPVVTIK